MELYHLRTFVAVAEEGHLTRASERLFTSQPAISAHIKALEEELGVVLFERTPRGMQLTAAGAKLLPAARNALASTHAFLNEAKAMQHALVGTVRIGLNTDASFLRLVPLQALLAERHPQLAVELLSGSTGANLPALRVGRLDASFVSGDVGDPLLRSWVLCDEELVIAAATGRGEHLRDADVAALAREPWVFTTEDCAHFGAMRTLFEAHCCTPRKTVMANQDDALAAMVAGGTGLGILRREVAEAYARQGRMYVLPMRLPPVSLRFACLAARANEPILVAVLGALAEVWSLEIAPAQRAAG